MEEILDKDNPTQPPQEGPLFPSNREESSPALKSAPLDKLLPSPKDPQTDQPLPTLMDMLLDSDIDIKIIRAAPFARLIRDGIEVYQLHISPVLNSPPGIPTGIQWTAGFPLQSG